MPYQTLTDDRSKPLSNPGEIQTEPVPDERPVLLQTVSDWLKAVYDRLDERRRVLLEPRKLIPPGGYHTPKCVAAGLDCILRINECKTDSERLPTEITAQAIVYRIINHRSPVYYVAEDFIRAVAATELPHDFTLADLHWPMPAMVLGFPVRFMREYLGRETCYVCATEFDAGDHRCRFLATPVITMPKAKVAFSWYACVDGRLESFVSSFWKADQVDEIIQKYSYTDYTGADAPKVQEDKECCDRLSVLMFKLLVVLSTRLNLVEPATCLRRACARKGRRRSELWSPNIIGANYRVVRKDATPTATHASPRLRYWRRGHLRDQPHGQGRTLRKLIWIEPMLIGIQE